MDKKEIKAERLRILKEETALYMRLEAGENVTTELRHCGKRLDNIGKQKSRVNVMDATEIKDGDKHNLHVVITETMYRKASNVGVGRKTLRQRIYRDGWDVERAMSKPKGRRLPSDVKGMTVEGYKHLKQEGLRDVDICEKYGIKRYVLHRFKQQNGITDTRAKAAVK